MNRKWRPSLGLVIGGALAGTLILSFLGLIALRYLGPEIGFRQAAMILSVIIAAITAVPGWLLVRLLLRPIHDLETYAAAQEQGQDAPAPRHFGTKEIDTTARGVISMAEALRDREATIRSYTDHVTHELKTPVSAIRAAVELLSDDPELSADNRVLLEQINGARLQMEAQLEALREAAQAREVRYLGNCEISEVIAELQGDHPNLTLTLEGDATRFPISGKGMAIILSQLLRNAAEHGAQTVQLVATAGQLTLQDNGSGISDGNAARIFEPFFTTKRESGGTGMGLAVVRSILHAHRGEIALVPSQTGTRFEIGFDQP